MKDDSRWKIQLQHLPAIKKLSQKKESVTEHGTVDRAIIHHLTSESFLAD